MRLLRPSLPFASAAVLGLAGCSATSSQPATDADEIRCVVSVEPTMRLVTFAPKAGISGGVTSVFFRQLPDVNPGDLVRLGTGAGHGGPQVARIEAGAPDCEDVAQTAADAHKHH